MSRTGSKISNINRFLYKFLYKLIVQTLFVQTNFQQINLFEILDSISSDLKWHSHIKNIFNKARKTYYAILKSIKHSDATILGSVQGAKADVQSVEAMLDSLNIQAVPSQVYRMGPFSVNNNQKRPRLVKVVLPSSRIQKNKYIKHVSSNKIPKLHKNNWCKN